MADTITMTGVITRSGVITMTDTMSVIFPSGQVPLAKSQESTSIAAFYKPGETMVTENFPREVTNLTICGYDGPLTAIPRWITCLCIENTHWPFLCPVQESDFIPGGYHAWQGDRSLVPQLRKGCPPPTRSSGLPEGLKSLIILNSYMVNVSALPAGLEELYVESYIGTTIYHLPGGDRGSGLPRLPSSLRVLSIGVRGHSQGAIKRIVPDSVQVLMLCEVSSEMCLDLSYLTQVTTLAIRFIHGKRRRPNGSLLLLPKSLKRLTLLGPGPKLEVGPAHLLECLKIGWKSKPILTNGVKVHSFEEYARAWRTPKSARSAYVVPE